VSIAGDQKRHPFSKWRGQVPESKPKPKEWPDFGGEPVAPQEPSMSRR
jgi:hypothetical protein